MTEQDAPESRSICVASLFIVPVMHATVVLLRVGVIAGMYCVVVVWCASTHLHPGAFPARWVKMLPRLFPWFQAIAC